MNELEKFDGTDYPQESKKSTIDILSTYMRTVLETVDEAKLQTFLLGELQRAGLSKDILEKRFVPIAEIVLDTETSGSRNYAAALPGRITFYPDATIRAYKKITDSFLAGEGGESSPEYESIYLKVAKLAALKTLIHEELHTIAWSPAEIHKTSPVKGEVTKEWNSRTGVSVQSGISTYRFDPELGKNIKIHQEREIIYDGINEGLTELMAQILTREYHRQHQVIDDPILAKYYFNYAEAQGSYHKERLVVEQLAVILAEILEVPHDVIIRSFFVEYVSNGSLLPAEFLHVLAEYLPTMSSEDIKRLDYELAEALTAESFSIDSDVFDQFKNLINLLPEEKADRCRAGLAQVFTRYHPGVATE